LYFKKPQEQVERTNRLFSKLPEVLERKKDETNQQDAEYRRRLVRRMEDQRRARMGQKLYRSTKRGEEEEESVLL